MLSTESPITVTRGFSAAAAGPAASRTATMAADKIPDGDPPPHRRETNEGHGLLHEPWYSPIRPPNLPLVRCRGSR